MSVESIITENLDIWTSAIKTKSASGRGSSNKIELYGIKKLRELILELAIRGKLVPQDTGEEPTSQLLKTLELNKLKLVKNKKIRKPKALPAIEEAELPFPIPSSWSYVRLNSIGDWGSGSTPKRSISEYYGGEIPWFKSGELSADYIHTSEETVTERALEETSLRYNNIGDVLIAMYGATIGKTSILNVRGTTNQAVCACTPFEGVVNIYLLLLLKAYKSRFIGMGAGGAQPNISREKIISTVVPLPPQSEQKRIVSKVEELMTLCDQLESQTEASIEAHQILVKSLLETLTNAKNADELNESWQRISEHFDVLFTTEDSIDQLKQTILQLAVMGKLVKQDPNEEPASKLLKRIAAEKERLIKNKKIKKQKALPLISEGEKPFQLPRGWEWCRLEDVVDIQSGITKGRKLAGKQVTKVAYLSVANVQRGFLKLEQLKDIEIAVEEVARYEVRAGDLLITEGGDWDKVGRTAIWNGSIPYIAHQNHVFKARKLLDEQNELWLETYLNSPFARDYFAGSSKQTTNLASINKTQLRGCLIAIPPSNHQSEILSSVRSVVELCESLLQKLKSKSKTECSLAELVAHR